MIGLDMMMRLSCAPDLLTITHDATMLTPSAWGSIVQSYLLAHAQ